MIEPLWNNVFVRISDDDEEKTDSGIVLAGNKKKPLPVEGEVAHIGPEVKAVRVGQRVLFERGESDEFILGGDRFAVLSEDHIIAILNIKKVDVD